MEVNMKNAVVFLADGFEEIEALTPVDYLRRGGAEVFTVAVPTSTMQDKYIVTGSHKIPVIADLSFDEFKIEFDSDLPDLVFFPGGMKGAENLAADVYIAQYIKKCFDAKKIVSAICAAPALVLAKTGILASKEWTCYPGMEQNLVQYIGSEELCSELMKNSSYVSGVPFVTDNNVVTGRGPGAAEQFAMELVALLCGKDVADKVKTASVQR